MATVTTLVDDLDGTPATQTLTFAVQSEDSGRLIEIKIDLNDENYEKYNEILLLLSSAGREVVRDVPVPAKRSVKPVGKSGSTAHIREALRAAGHEVSDRGRISAPLMEIYNKLDKTPKAPEKEGGENGTAGKPDAQDEDKKAEEAVIARVKATPKAGPTTRRKSTADKNKATQVEIPALRTALSLVGDEK